MLVLVLVYKCYLVGRALHAYERAHVFLCAWLRLSLKVSVLLLGWCHGALRLPWPWSICGQKDGQRQMI